MFLLLKLLLSLLHTRLYSFLMEFLTKDEHILQELLVLVDLYLREGVTLIGKMMRVIRTALFHLPYIYKK